MNHEQIKSEIFEYADSELDQVAHQEIKAHLNECAECRAELEAWKQISGILFDRNTYEEPANFAEKVMARIAQSQPSAPDAESGSWMELWGLPRWEILTASAVLAVAILYSILVRSPGQAAASLDNVLLSSADIVNGSALLFSEKETGREDAANAVLGEGVFNE